MNKLKKSVDRQFGIKNRGLFFTNTKLQIQGFDDKEFSVWYLVKERERFIDKATNVNKSLL